MFLVIVGAFLSVAALGFIYYAASSGQYAQQAATVPVRTEEQNTI